MKRISIYLFLVVSSFFVSVTFAHADTTYPLNDSLFSYLNNIDTAINTCDTYLSNNPTYAYYAIYYLSSFGGYTGYSCIFTSNEPKIRYAGTGIQPPQRFYQYFTGNVIAMGLSSDFTTLSTLNLYLSVDFAIYYYNQVFFSPVSLLLYSSISLLPHSNNDCNSNIIYTYNGDILTRSCRDPYYTFYDLDNYFNGSPPDDTPLLSSFVTLVLDRLSYICDFFTSSYVLLSMFVIFIFYFVIYFFRRFL